jgi:hypothetical protein
MDVPVSCIVPNTLGLNLKGIQVCGMFVVSVSVGTAITTATDITADKTNPEIRSGRAVHAGRKRRRWV